MRYIPMVTFDRGRVMQHRLKAKICYIKNLFPQIVREKCHHRHVQKVRSHETIYCLLSRDHAEVTIQPGKRQ